MEDREMLESKSVIFINDEGELEERDYTVQILETKIKDLEDDIKYYRLKLQELANEQL